MLMRGPAPSVSRWIGDYLAGSPIHLLRLILGANGRSAIGTALSPPATGANLTEAHLALPGSVKLATTRIFIKSYT